jgi:hypothetical protein
LADQFDATTLSESSAAAGFAMAFSLYAAIVPSYLQILQAVSGLLAKAESFCADRKIAPAEFLQTRLADDMLPFAYQIRATVTHSLGAIEGVRKGVFSPDTTPPPETFAALNAKITEAIAALEAIGEAEVNAFVGRDMRFSFRERQIEFTAENFLLSFSQPNFYFHATTAYDILRWKGLAIGKRDFIGKTRSKQ